MQYERVDVECYSGHKVNERPLAFTFRGNRLEITEIIDRWYQGNPNSQQPSLDYFKVRTATSEEYIIRYNTLFDAWSVLIP